jgi:O-antigen/teichoic acid export membrane protein
MEHKTLALRHNLSWSLTGNVLYALTQWGMVVVLAKLGTPEMVGQFALGLAVTAPVIMFTNLNLQVVQATDARNHYRFQDYLSLRFVTTTVALLLILGLVFVADYRLETALVILLMGLAKAFEAVSDIFYGLLQKHERMDRVAKSMILKGILSLSTLAIVVYFTNSLVWGVISLAFVWATVLFGYDTYSGAHILTILPQTTDKVILLDSTKPASLLRPTWAPHILARLAWLALPLGLVMALISLNMNIPRYFVNGYLGEHELGIFAAIAYIMVAGQLAVTALGQSTSSRLARYYAAYDGVAFRTLLFKLLCITALLGVTGVLIALVAGEQVLMVFYGPEYAESADVFVWLMAAAGISYMSSILGYGMTAARYFQIQLPLFGFVGFISTVLCFLLVPTAGLQGAAMALLVAAVVQLCGSLAIVGYALYILRRFKC